MDLPATDRRPEEAEAEEAAERVEREASEAKVRCWPGSFALMASAKALAMNSSSAALDDGWMVALDAERKRPGVGMLLAFPGVGIADTRGLPGVGVDMGNGEERVWR